MELVIPKAFISYSHDTLEHKKWVLELATRLRNNGIDAILDQFELQAGDDVPHFMETNLANANKILMISTERYVEKANNGEGGVGYEKMIITSNLLKRIDENKIIPLIRQSGTTKVPTFLKSKLYINFSKNDDFEFSYDDLVRSIHNTPLFKKPPIGNNPFQQIEKEKIGGDIETLNLVLKTIATMQDNSAYVSGKDIAVKLNISYMFFRAVFMKLEELGYAEWSHVNFNARITNKGILYAYNNGLV
ncbi:MAG: TIR domain-containing protein [Saprospiraceae bacterium]|uniref:TIR domain-containing protein n=1 Tax=Candidatus Defluviibacterium haderslevense TaxID=2981993 RepID=A0A9D7S933_9BACT|nr:TIR domain-containing protein [Candidatus Defluviibacterium haderslevense]